MHCFYIDETALSEGFDQIASLTGTEPKFLDVNSENGSKEICKFFAPILRIHV